MTTPTIPDDLLSQYPGPVRLQTAGKTILLPVIMVAAAAVVLFFSDDPHHKAYAIVYGGLFALYAAAQNYWPTTIELTAWGFSTYGILNGSTKSRWRDVSEFEVIFWRSAQVKYFDKNDEGRRWFSDARLLVKVYPFSAEQMAALMNAWRQRSLFG